MKGLTLPLAAGALLALAALVGVQLLRPAAEPSRAELARQIASELRCPDCQSLSVAESHTAAAGAIREQISELLAAGATADEVRQHFVDRYGEWILLAPAAGFAWWLPAAVLLAALGLLSAWLLRGRGRVSPPASAAGDSPELRRVRDEIESLDA
jgi:cytochrome c-type biogenesis protein CcmH